MRCDDCPVRPGPACLGETHRIGDTRPLCRDVEAGLPGRAEQLAALAEGRPLPGPLAMAGSALRAGAAFVADGGRMASPEVRAARAAACDACPHLAIGADRCALCGCHLSAKRAVASSRCPDDPPRWDTA